MTSILGLKGQRSVSFHLHFAHLTIHFSFSFSFFHTIPVRCPPITFRLSLPLHHLPIPLSPPLPRYSSFPVLLSFLSFVLTYPSPLLLTLPCPYPPLLSLFPYSLFSKLPPSSPPPLSHILSHTNSR